MFKKFKAALAKILSEKYWVWKLKKNNLLYVIKCVILKQTQTILKTIPSECRKITGMCNEWMSEYSIFIMNVEKHFLRSKRKRLQKHVYIVYFSCTKVLDRKKRTKFTDTLQCRFKRVYISTEFFTKKFKSWLRMMIFFLLDWNWLSGCWVHVRNKQEDQWRIQEWFSLELRLLGDFLDKKKIIKWKFWETKLTLKSFKKK